MKNQNADTDADENHNNKKTMVIDNGNANNDEMAAGGAEKPKCDRKYPPEAQTLLVPLGRGKKIL